jgi:hypothetical protein
LTCLAQSPTSRSGCDIMVHDTHMSQFIPPTFFHFSTGTITYIAGQVVGTVVAHRAAANQTTLITVPVLIPSNSQALKGSYLKSIEIDYEILTAEPTSLTWTINKVTRGANGADATIATPAFTSDLSAATAKAVDEHKIVHTITTPFWIDNDEYVLVELALEAGAGGNTADFLGAVANFTERM